MKPYEIIHGDCLAVLATLPAESVHCCITSPPYFALRDYGHADQIGLEATPAEYVAKIVEAFREVRRVLRDDGTLWLNLGDSYSGNGTIGRNDANRDIGGRGGNKLGSGNPGPQGARQIAPGLKPKDLIGIPWRVAFALQADGWTLRQDIVWAKPNPMPESVKDRCTKAHEYVFLLTKGPRYYYDADAIKEPATMKPQRRLTPHAAPSGVPGQPDHNGVTPSRGESAQDYDSRNKRSVWTVTPKPFKLWAKSTRLARVASGVISGDMMHRVSADCPHHASLAPPGTSPERDERGGLRPDRTGSTTARPDPEPSSDSATTGPTPELLTPARSSDCSPLSCGSSATPRSTRSRRTAPAPATSPPCTPCVQTASRTGDTLGGHVPDGRQRCTPANSTGSASSACSASDETRPGTADIPVSESLSGSSIRTLLDVGCTCSFYTKSTQETSHFAVMPEKLVEPCILAGCPEGGTVLDPFAGSGTVGAVAVRNGRRFVGVELNAGYRDMAERRCAEAAGTLFAGAS